MSARPTDTALRAPASCRRRLKGADWAAITAELDEFGCALTPELLSAADASQLIRLYEQKEPFRSTIDMRRHRFGEGQYRYLAYPLPEVIDDIRRALYPRLLPIARDWYGKWNALHRDVYGELVFPLQVVINLTIPEVDYTGGEFVLAEQRPRAQSRPTALALPRGRGLIFTTRDRPVRSVRGWSASPVRHGASVVRSGGRFALGILFHDAP
jgi:hypothetical protein